MGHILHKIKCTKFKFDEVLYVYVPCIQHPNQNIEHSHYSREFFHAHLKSISSVSCSKHRSDPYHFRFVLHVLDFIQLELLYTLHTVYTFCIWFLLLSIIKKFFSSILLNVIFVDWTFIVLQSSISLWEYTQFFFFFCLKYLY